MVYSNLETTAIDMLTPGFDDDSGFGLIGMSAVLIPVELQSFSIE